MTMKKLLFSFFLLPAFFLVGFFVQIQAQESGEEVRAYIRIKSDKPLPEVIGLLRHDFGDGVHSIGGPAAKIDKIKNNPNIEFRGYASQWQLASHLSSSSTCNPTAALPWGITKINAGQSGGGSGLKVAVVDTGVYTSHPDLKNNIILCRDTQYSSIRYSCSDGNGHGTHVAGTIAANGKIKGVSPDAKIIAIKVCSNGGICWSDDIARGVRLAADSGANIINLSLGGSSITQDEKNAVNYAIGKGVLMVAAAGNSGPSDNTIIYPAALSAVVAVGATTSSDGIASFSSRGNNYNTTSYVVEERDIEFAAPGASVESTWNNGCYRVLSGTSMGTPHVAGLAAKVWQGSAASTRSYLQNRAKNNYTDIGRTGDDPDAGFGLPTAP